MLPEGCYESKWQGLETIQRTLLRDIQMDSVQSVPESEARFHGIRCTAKEARMVRLLKKSSGGRIEHGRKANLI